MVAPPVSTYCTRWPNYYSSHCCLTVTAGRPFLCTRPGVLCVISCSTWPHTATIQHSRVQHAARPDQQQLFASRMAGLSLVVDPVPVHKINGIGLRSDDDGIRRHAGNWGWGGFISRGCVYPWHVLWLATHRRQKHGESGQALT